MSFADTKSWYDKFPPGNRPLMSTISRNAARARRSSAMKLVSVVPADDYLSVPLFTECFKKFVTGHLSPFVSGTTNGNANAGGSPAVASCVCGSGPTLATRAANLGA